MGVCFLVGRRKKKLDEGEKEKESIRNGQVGHCFNSFKYWMYKL